MAEVRRLTDYVKGEVRNFEVISIEGGKELKEYLNELGIREGVKVSFQGSLTHEHRGPLGLELEGKKLVLAQGIADKVIMDVNGVEKHLLEMEAGENGILKKIAAGKEARDILEKLGLKEGTKIKVSGHVAEESFKIKVDDKELELCTGEASKILVENGGQSLQLSYLAPGDRGKIAGIIGGIHLEERLKEAGIGIGKEIELISRKTTAGLAKHAGCIFYLTVDNQLAVSIGRGMAEKVMVSPINQGGLK
ncbi:MAG: ferrous iron transport protein A [Candidatus Desulfofervidus sp.]|nr:ferrous iron transport protein A [Candidatus Desulfofervidus sp.]